MSVTLGKIVLLLTDGRSGWSETYWKTGPDLTTLLTLAKGIGQARAQLCGFGCSVQYVRVSDQSPGLTAAQKRVSQVDFPSGFASTSLVFTTAKYQADIASTSLLIRFTGTTSGRRYMRHLSGIPDILFDAGQPNGFNSTDPKWVAAWSNFNTLVTTGLLGFRYNSATPPTISYAVENSASATVERSQRKNRGRPFFQPVGRRLA